MKGVDHETYFMLPCVSEYISDCSFDKSNPECISVSIRFVASSGSGKVPLAIVVMCFEKK